MRNNSYIKNLKNIREGKNIEDNNIRYKESVYDFADEITNPIKNQRVGTIK